MRLSSTSSASKEWGGDIHRADCMGALNVYMLNVSVTGCMTAPAGTTRVNVRKGEPSGALKAPPALVTAHVANAVDTGAGVAVAVSVIVGVLVLVAVGVLVLVAVGVLV